MSGGAWPGDRFMNAFCEAGGIRSNRAAAWSGERPLGQTHSGRSATKRVPLAMCVDARTPCPLPSADSYTRHGSRWSESRSSSWSSLSLSRALSTLGMRSGLKEGSTFESPAWNPADVFVQDVDPNSVRRCWTTRSRRNAAVRTLASRTGIISSSLLVHVPLSGLNCTSIRQAAASRLRRSKRNSESPRSALCLQVERMASRHLLNPLADLDAPTPSSLDGVPAELERDLRACQPISH